MQDNIINNSIIQLYKDKIKTVLKITYPQLSFSEVEEAIDYSIRKRCEDTPVHIDNNYKNKKLETSLLNLMDFIINQEPIISSFGMLFKQHSKEINLLNEMIQSFINDRDIVKHEMFKYEKGSELFNRYELSQLLLKIDANGSYGAIGAFSCLFFNVNIASAITVGGQSAIATAGCAFEQFLANNIKFINLNEIINFIDNIIHEERIYNDNNILDNDILPEQVFIKIIYSCGYGYIPDKDECVIILDILYKLNRENLNRIYYKNNIFEFINNTYITNIITNMLIKLDKPYLDPNKKPKEISSELDDFWGLINEYVCYNHQIIDRIERIQFLPRKVSSVIDTDSNFVYMEPIYRFILDKVRDVDMKIKSIKTDMFEYLKYDEFGDVTTEFNTILYPETGYDYDFENDELIEFQRNINTLEIIPQDGLRFSIINIMAYCCYKYVNNYMQLYVSTFNANKREEKPCSLIMKNEFLFKSVLLTGAKKNYASKIELQEGKVIPSSKSLDIKGLPINKSTLNINTSKELKRILYEEVLDKDDIDIKSVLKELIILENRIYKSLASGDRTYYKPVTVKSHFAYDDPLRISGIKGCIAWNTISDNDDIKFDLEVRNSFEMVKVDMNIKNIDKIKITYPDIYERMVSLFEMDRYNTGLNALSIPNDISIPDWVFEFIDYKTIINDNLKTFPLESLGIYVGQKTNNTNIISF